MPQLLERYCLRILSGQPYGLIGWPSFHPTLADSHSILVTDAPLAPPGRDNSDASLDLVSSVVRSLSSGSTILEIGVALNSWEWTFTKRLLEERPADCKYIGLDIADRSNVISQFGDAHFLCCNSSEQRYIRSELERLGVSKIDLLLIDGAHDVNSTLNDWGYADLVAPDGVVLVHDTNSHPGPIALVRAVDRGLFEVEEPLADTPEYGMVVIRKKATNQQGS